MRSLLTVGALAVLLASALVLRSRWPRLPRRLHRAVLATALLLLLLESLTDVTKWGPSASRLDDLLVWGRVVGYVVLVILFTRLRPRALTTAIAVVLLFPLLAASIYLPLEHLFSTAPRHVTPVTDTISLETELWQSAGGDNYGVDYTISERARRLPFLQHTLKIGRLYRTQCDIDAMSAFLSQTTRQVILHCPPAAAGEPPLDEKIRLQ